MGFHNRAVSEGVSGQLGWAGDGSVLIWILHYITAGLPD